MNFQIVNLSYYRFVDACFVSLCILFLLSSHPASAAPKQPRWSVVVYAGLDEEEIAEYGDPMVARILKEKLGPDVELLMENETWSSKFVTRTIRGGGRATRTTTFPNGDSADVANFKRFLDWAAKNARGKQRLFIVMTHSWGWKGIIQDYQVPGHEEEDAFNTMMPVREFANAITGSKLKPDVLFLDSCVLGNVETVDMMRDIARYLVVSQRETPYSGYPYPVLFKDLHDPRYSPREIAARIPEADVKAFIRGGSQAGAEGEYIAAGMVTLDMTRWEPFMAGFRKLVELLAASGFREKLKQDLEWPAKVADGDANYDVIELLQRLPEIEPDRAVVAHARKLLAQLGYPAAEDAKSKSALTLLPEKVKFFELHLQGDEVALPSKRLELFKKKWHEANLDLDQPETLELSVVNPSPKTSTFVVRGTVEEALRLRPWLPGVKKVELWAQNKSGEWSRRRLKRHTDYVATREFPASSFMIAEAHTNGAPFIHGLGVNFKPLMDDGEERGEDPITKLLGPAFYKSTSWNQRTGWGDLILMN